jgi:uncharacterized protein
MSEPPPSGRPVRVTELTREQCLQHVADHHFGRVVVRSTGTDNPPVVRPVNYAYERDSNSVAFRCAEGSKFYALVHSTQACFEIDDADQSRRSGWSVIICGVTEPVVAPMELRRLEELALDSWAATPDPHWIRIRARTVSGRQVG